MEIGLGPNRNAHHFHGTFFELVIPFTMILLQYITNALYEGDFNNSILTVAFILLIHVLTLYVPMIAKYCHETHRNK
jgi:hypothetical protein